MRKIIISGCLICSFMLAIMLVNSFYLGAQDKPADNKKPAPATEADNKTDLTVKIDGLITQLGDVKYEVREDAQGKLLKIGKPIIIQLVNTMNQTDDPEIKQRGKLILFQLDAELNDKELSELEQKAKEAKKDNEEYVWKALEKWLGGRFNGLQFNIAFDQKSYSLGKGKDVMNIEFMLKNTGKDDIWVRQSVDDWAAESVFFYEITGPNGLIKAERMSSDFAPLKVTKDNFKLLKSHDLYNFKRVIKNAEVLGGFAFSVLEVEDTSLHWILDKPGKYRIRARYVNQITAKEFNLKGWTGEVFSNTVTIELK